MTRTGLGKHLTGCSRRVDAVRAAGQKRGKPQEIYHLQAQDAWKGDYWLHLEMNGSATLETLDDYLREIWLECCGHLSEFSIGGFGGPVIGKRTRAREVFAPGIELTHIYDFGTSSETLITVLEARMGNPLTRRPIVLLARNALPPVNCMECERPAKWLCPECIYESDGPGTLCDEHIQDHPHEDYGGPLPYVNSPRVGMCGYRGPAEPPY
jgi:hypothetical protein